MSYCTDKLMIDGQTHAHTHTQATTIPEGQNWPRVKRCDGRTDRQTDRRTDRRKIPFVELLVAAKNNRAPLLSNIKLYASFHHHMWIQTGVTVRKRLSWVVTSVTLTFDLWPWPFAWTLLLSLVITPENFMMIQWWEHSQKGVTDRQTDGQTENTICRAA